MTNRLKIAAIAVLSFAGLPAIAASQRVDQLQEGARVRIVAAKGHKLIGSATLVTQDSMSIVFPGSTQSVRFALRDAKRVEVSTGINRVEGAVIYGLIGLGIGATTGAAFGAAFPHSEKNCLVCGRAFSAYVGGLVIGTIGTVAGIVGGASQGWEGWKPVAH